jgi:transcriptional regulator with PAS, ATPase and Fis domain
MRLVTPSSPRGAAGSRPCRRRADARSDLTRLLSLLTEFADDTATPWADRLEQALKVLLPIESVNLEAHFQADHIDSTHSRSELEFRSPLTPDGRYFALRVVPCRGYEPDGWDRQLLAQVAALSVVVLDHASGVSVLGARRTTTRPRRSLAESMLVGSSPVMQKLREQIERFATTRFTVLIQGESGTGKDIVARLIHGRSPRSTGPFVVVNCAALVDSLLDAEFFGIEDRTATGVRARAGLFEQADGGTLFFDELSELALTAQAKLLRVVQDMEVKRVGARASRHCDARLIAATNRPLRDLLERHSLRDDLYYRLSGLEIVLPPLRQRGSDILELAGYFLTLHGDGRALRLSSEVKRALTDYQWPGNVRELERTIQTAIAVSTQDEITMELLPPRMTGLLHDGVSSAFGAGLSAREASARFAELVLRQCGGNKSEASRRLGISPHTLKARLAYLASRRAPNRSAA